MSGRQMSQTANFPGRQLSLQPNVQERNVLGANCPERQLSGRQMSKAPNVGRQMSGRGLAGAGAICLPSCSNIVLWHYFHLLSTHFHLKMIDYTVSSKSLILDLTCKRLF